VTAGAPAEPVAVSASEVRKSYGARQILTGVSFEVRRGELMALLGPNGAGKTTTVEILEGYRTADGGSVRVLGLDPARDGRALRPRIGLMLQEGGIDNRSTPREVLRLYARFYLDPEDPDALLEAVDLGRAATTRYRRLSGGEKQRLSLAIALLGRPELLVLDEPTAGMDPALVARLAGWCAEHGLLITELRVGAASLEERYLELVGADVADEAEGAA